MTSEELKAFCKERNLTYKELGEAIGMSEATLRSNISKGIISEQTARAIELLKHIEALENELKEFRALKEILKNIIK